MQLVAAGTREGQIKGLHHVLSLPVLTKVGVGPADGTACQVWCTQRMCSGSCASHRRMLWSASIGLPQSPHHGPRRISC